MPDFVPKRLSHAQVRAELMGAVHTRDCNDKLRDQVAGVRNSLSMLVEKIKTACASERARLSEDQAGDRLYELLTPLLDPDKKVDTTKLVAEVVIRARTVLDVLPQSVRERLGAALFSPDLSLALQKFINEDLNPLLGATSARADPFSPLQEEMRAFHSSLNLALTEVGTTSMVRDFSELSKLAISIDQRLSELKDLAAHHNLTRFEDTAALLLVMLDNASTRVSLLVERTTGAVPPASREVVELGHHVLHRPDKLRIRQIFDDVLDPLASPIFRAPIVRALLYSQVQEPIESLFKHEGAWSAREHFSSALHDVLSRHPEFTHEIKEALANPMGVRDKSGTWSNSIEHLTATIGRLTYFKLCDAIELRLSEFRNREARREVPALVQMHESSKRLAEWFGAPVPGRENRGAFFRQIKSQDFYPIDALAKRVSGIDSIEALLATTGLLPKKKSKRRKLKARQSKNNTYRDGRTKMSSSPHNAGHQVDE